MHVTSYEYGLPFIFRMVSSTNYLAPMPGLSPLPTVTIRKPGGSFISTDGVVTELGDGWYQITNPTMVTGETVYVFRGFSGASADPEGVYLLKATATGAVGSGLYVLTPLDKSTPIDEQVWDAAMGDHTGDDTVGCAVYNALRGYHLTAGGAGGVASGTVGLKLSAAGLDSVVAEPAAGGFLAVNARQALQWILARLGTREGAGSGETTCKNFAGTVNRIVIDTPGTGDITITSQDLTA
jgi:hypothetical protein